MSNSWKEAIREYYQFRNRVVTHRNVDEFGRFYTNDEGALSEKRRWSRYLDQLKDRGAKGSKSETKVKILESKSYGPQMVVKLALHQRLLYELKMTIHEEERVELREFLLENRRDGWKIARESSSWEGESFVQRELPIWNAGPVSSYSNARSYPSPLINQEILNSGKRGRPYNRSMAQRYADLWWNSYNPDYRHFSVDCTNYVSQCLHAGGAPMNHTGRRDRGWWYKGGSNQENWSYSWAVAHSLRFYLSGSRTGLRAAEMESVQDLTIGDVICYDFDNDGRWQHNTIVTAFDAMGVPLVNAHTDNSRHRYWDYRDSYAHTESTKYTFLKIVDEF